MKTEQYIEQEFQRAKRNHDKVNRKIIPALKLTAEIINKKAINPKSVSNGVSNEKRLTVFYSVSL